VLSDVEITVRLLIALGFGALIGLERELHKKTAGLRTHMLVSLSTCLLMILSVESAEMLEGHGAVADPTRIAAGVITGIGFLGAGSIIRHGANVQGLTTAASIWTSAAVGLTTGVGMFIPAAMVVALALFTLYSVNRIDLAYKIQKRRSNLLITAHSSPGFLDRLEGVFSDMDVDAGPFQVSVAHRHGGMLVVDIQLRDLGGHERSHVADRILGLPSVESVEFY
jgi:putative Mg2+ transporter-C (MgtC) family protein